MNMRGVNTQSFDTQSFGTQESGRFIIVVSVLKPK